MKGRILEGREWEIKGRWMEEVTEGRKESS